MSFSACFLSPIDSSWCFFARSWKPQSAHIFDWQKYWLIAVSSMVSAPLSPAMTSDCPFMILLLLSTRTVRRPALFTLLRRRTER